MNLLEVITVLVVLGLAIPALLNLFAEVSRKNIQAEFAATASSVAEELMEEIRAKRFDENLRNLTSPASLGPDTGETRTTYDDVDDFHNLSETITAGNLSFSRSVQVYYINPQSPPASNMDSEYTGAATQYKRIRITVSSSQLGTLDVVNLVILE